MLNIKKILRKYVVIPLLGIFRFISGITILTIDIVDDNVFALLLIVPIILTGFGVVLRLFGLKPMNYILALSQTYGFSTMTWIWLSVILPVMFISWHISWRNKDASYENYRREKRIMEIVKEKGLDMSEATEIYFQEKEKKIKDKKKDELLGGFVKILEYLRGGRNFYLRFIFIFVIVVAGCSFTVYLLAEHLYQAPPLDGGVSRIITLGIFRNIRFLIYESLIITLLGYCLKKISNYISMIEVYKELEILLIMDVQRQATSGNKNELEIVSVEFQEKFSKFIIKHEDHFLKRKDEIKIKSLVELINSLQKK